MKLHGQLLYLWIDDFNIFKNQEFYFTDKISVNRHEIKKNTIELTITQNNVASPNIINEIYPHSPVTSASIIVGNNGAGKTSIAEILYYIYTLGLADCNYILIFENLNHSYSVYKSAEIKIKTNINTIKDKQELDNYIYYSPCFTTQHHMKNLDNFIDLSTSYLLATDICIRGNNIIAATDILGSPINNHRFMEIRRVCALLSFLNNKDNIDDFRKQLPFQSNLNITPIELSKLYRDKDNWKLTQRKTQPEKFTKSDKIKKLLYYVSLEYVVSLHANEMNKDEKNIYKEHFLNYATLVIYNNYLVIHKYTGQIDYDNLDEKLKSISFCQYLLNLISMQEKKYTKQSTNNPHIALYNFINKLPKDFFYETGGRTTIPFITLELKDYLEKAITFIDVYQNCSFNDFLDIDMYPRLSSGESNILSLFARLYEIKDRLTNSNNIIFLDEIETTLHFSIQVKIVKLIIEFINLAFSDIDAQFQLVFATHSPLLLSDFLPANTIKLKTRNTSYNKFTFADTKELDVLRGIDDESMFGANLYKILSEGFFLQNGMIGDLSKSLINILIENQQISHEHKEQLINLYGDPIIKMLIKNSIKYNHKDETEK